MNHTKKITFGVCSITKPFFIIFGILSKVMHFAHNEISFHWFHWLIYSEFSYQQNFEKTFELTWCLMKLNFLSNRTTARNKLDFWDYFHHIFFRLFERKTWILNLIYTPHRWSLWHRILRIYCLCNKSKLYIDSEDYTITVFIENIPKSKVNNGCSQFLGNKSLLRFDG